MSNHFKEEFYFLGVCSFRCDCLHMQSWHGFFEGQCGRMSCHFLLLLICLNEQPEIHENLMFFIYHKLLFYIIE